MSNMKNGTFEVTDEESRSLVIHERVQKWLAEAVHSGFLVEKSEDEITEMAFDKFDNDENEFAYTIRRAVEGGLRAMGRVDETGAIRN